MKILAYGFKPYGTYQKNISQQVLSRLKRRGGQVVVKVFPVKFDRRQFERAVLQLKPDMILGLGQYPRGKKVRIERRAVNLFGTRGKRKMKISSSGPQVIRVSWKIDPDSSSWVSYNARCYVCNFSMYVIGYMAREQQIPFAFLHIPKDYDVRKATAFVERNLQQYST